MRSDVREYRILEKSKDPLILAAKKIAYLKRYLFYSQNDGCDDNFTRASGDVICEICGDSYRDHDSVD